MSHSKHSHEKRIGGFFGNNAFIIFLILVLLALSCGGFCGYGY